MLIFTLAPFMSDMVKVANAACLGPRDRSYCHAHGLHGALTRDDRQRDAARAWGLAGRMLALKGPRIQTPSGVWRAE